MSSGAVNFDEKTEDELLDLITKAHRALVKKQGPFRARVMMLSAATHPTATVPSDRRTKVSMTSAAVLKFLDGTSGAPFGPIRQHCAGHSGVTTATVSNAISSLLRKGLILRRGFVGEYNYSISDTGRAALTRE